MILIDSHKAQLMGTTIQLMAEFSRGICDLIKAQAEAEGKSARSLAPIMTAEITGAVLHALATEEKKNAAE